MQCDTTLCAIEFPIDCSLGGLMSRKLILNKFVVFTTLFVLGNSGFAGEPLKVCGHPDYPPFMWQQAGHTVGLATEIAQIIFQELNITVDNRFDGNWSRCQKEVELGRIDLIVSAYITDERKGFADFTANYISDDPAAVFVMKGKEFKFEQWEDLIGKSMGGILGGSLGSDWDNFTVAKLNVVNVSTRAQVFKMLEKGKIDFTPLGLFTGQIQIEKLKYQGRIVPLDHPITTGYLYVAMSKKSPFLRHLPYISKRLLELRKDGTINRLRDKYVSEYAAAAPD